MVNLSLYLAAFRALTPKPISNRQLIPGALIGGAAWTALQIGGTLLINHELRNTSQVYGFFAIVLGLLAWIYLGALVTIYAAEVNVVRARHLWPRGVLSPPRTEADRRVLAAISHQSARQPGQRVTVSFDEETQPYGSEPQPKSTRAPGT
ncbi:MAG: YhjD/YihY/BrkB family envelope integrity protein [Acidimicrobiales bacterium]